MREDSATATAAALLRGGQGKADGGGRPAGKPRFGGAAASWGSQLVRGLADHRKSKKPPAGGPAPAGNAPAARGSNTQLNQPRVKRALIGDFPCSPSPAQIHPDQRVPCSPASRELFFELDSLRAHLRESKEREIALQEELRRVQESPRVAELEKALEAKNQELRELGRRGDGEQTLEVEVLELRRLNKELQLQKRSLAFQLATAESMLAAGQGNDIVAEAQAEASLLRHTNASLSKQVEGLQMSRLTEVEEIAYLRWINSCLRRELGNSAAPAAEAIDLQFCNADDDDAFSEASAPGDEIRAVLLEAQQMRSAARRHSIGGSAEAARDLAAAQRRQSDNFSSEVLAFEMNHVAKEKPVAGDGPKPKPTATCRTQTLDVERRALRVPNPPPRLSATPATSAPAAGVAPRPPLPPPPPPPPPPKFPARGGAVMRRAPQVAELYHSLMKRDSRKDASSGAAGDSASSADARSSMIGEIETRSSHLLAIKADVETQAEFVRSLIKEVNGAVFRDIDDVVAFVKWLDDELGFLVDERAVLKHFDWPERKADALREAAFGYRDLKKLETELSSYAEDDGGARLPCDVALKKIASLSEKAERSVYNLVRARDGMMRQCKDFGIPTEWMLDANLICKIKFASVQLAKKYMKRVAAELKNMGTLNKDPALEYMLLQGVRFAFRVHQFAGGFDTETMDAFEELRNLVYVRNSSSSSEI